MVMERADAVLKGEEPYRLEFRIVRPDGRCVFCATKQKLSFDPSGQPASLVGIVQDITDSKLAEEALGRSESRLGEAQRIAHLGNWEWDIRQNTGCLE